MKRGIAILALASLAVAMFFLPSAAAAARQRVTVRSNNFRYNYYEIDVRGRVELVNQLSNAPCEYRRSWGYDRDGIWVDNGCAAEFDVYDDANEGRNKVSGKTAAIIAGVAGAAILTGVLVAKNRNKDKNKTTGNNTPAPDDKDSAAKARVPDWLVGTFANRAKNTELGIYDDGTLVVKQNGRERFYGNYYDGKLFYNGVKLQLVKDGDGFNATDLNTKEVTYFERAD